MNNREEIKDTSPHIEPDSTYVLNGADDPTHERYISGQDGGKSDNSGQESDNYHLLSSPRNGGKTKIKPNKVANMPSSGTKGKTKFICKNYLDEFLF